MASFESVKNILLQKMAETDGTGRQIKGGETKVLALFKAVEEMSNNPKVQKTPLVEELATVLNQWHGKYKGRIENVQNLYARLAENQATWNVSEEMLDLLWAFAKALSGLFSIDRNSIKSENRLVRNTILHSAVRYSLREVKYWVLERYVAGVISLADVNLLGFFVESDQIIARERRKETDELPRLWVRKIGLDCVSIKVATPVKGNTTMKHYWPKSVHFAIIRIMDKNGTVLFERVTSRKHNRFNLSSEYRGQLLMAKAAYLAHIDDVPTFPPDASVFNTDYAPEDIARH